VQGIVLIGSRIYMAGFPHVTHVGVQLKG